MSQGTDQLAAPAGAALHEGRHRSTAATPARYPLARMLYLGRHHRGPSGTLTAIDELLSVAPHGRI